jgi:hypothetical protein
MNYIHQHSGYESHDDSPELSSSRPGNSSSIDGSSIDGRSGSSGSGGSSDSWAGLGGDKSGSLSIDEDGEREAAARAAIFYSINSTQPGLRGIELGNSLIKRVKCKKSPLIFFFFLPLSTLCLWM